MAAHGFGVNNPGFGRAYFDGALDSLQVVSLKLLQKEYMHDIIMVDIFGAPMDSKRFRTGAPVYIEYGTSGQNVDAFYGYVNHLEPEVQRAGSVATKKTLRVVAVGASWVLKQPIQKNYTGRTASSIMREIAEGSKFTTDIQESSVVWSTLTNPGMTTWQFLVLLAQRMGNTLLCSKTEIRCYDQLTQLRQQSGRALVFYGAQTVTSTVTIDDFKPISGETTPDGGERAVRIGYGMDPRTGELFSASNDMSEFGRDQLGRESTTPFFQKFMNNVVLTDRMQAKDRLGAEAKVNRFHIQATATLAGNVKVTQGSVVTLLNVGDKNSGNWYVHEVEHCLDAQHYEMHVLLGRDSVGLVGDEDAAPARRVVRERYDPFDSKVSFPPPTLLVDGQWRSAYAAKKQVV